LNSTSDIYLNISFLFLEIKEDAKVAIENAMNKNSYILLGDNLP
jgi:hypothetical protein